MDAPKHLRCIGWDFLSRWLCSNALTPGSFQRVFSTHKRDSVNHQCQSALTQEHGDDLKDSSRSAAHHNEQASGSGDNLSSHNTSVLYKIKDTWKGWSPPTRLVFSLPPVFAAQTNLLLTLVPLFLPSHLHTFIYSNSFQENLHLSLFPFKKPNWNPIPRECHFLTTVTGVVVKSTGITWNVKINSLFALGKTISLLLLVTPVFSHSWSISFWT